MTEFNPSDHLMDLKGKAYLEVKWRLVWLRETQPNASIITELVEHVPGKVAIFKATVMHPDGGMGTGHGSESPGDFGDYIEKAETKAIGRALGALGYGTQFCDDFDTPIAPDGRPRIVDSPIPPRPQAPQPRPQAPQPPGERPQMRNPDGPPSEKQMAFLSQLGKKVGLITDDGDTSEFTRFMNELGPNEWPDITGAQCSRAIDILKTGAPF